MSLSRHTARGHRSHTGGLEARKTWWMLGEIRRREIVRDKQCDDDDDDGDGRGSLNVEPSG